jgi:hypothetical protein
MSFRTRPEARLALVALVLAGASASAACRSKKPSGAAASASVSASSAAEVAAGRCRALKPGAALVIGSPSVRAKAPDEEEDPELPFATALGTAAALSNVFAVSGVSARDGGTEAFVAFVPSDGKPGRTVSLGPVHGDPEPPLIAADGDRVLVAVESSDAAGRTVELYRLAPTGDKPERGPEIIGVGDEGIGLGVGEKSGVVVWSSGKGDKAMLRSAPVNRATPGVLGTVTEIAGTGDAESPVVRPRPGGYWLAWIAQRRIPDGGVRDAGSPEETSPLDAVPRVLTVALLDADGRPSGAARAVSGDASHVVVFDATTLSDGALALAWREDDAAPGVETGGPELARVAPDGAVTRGRATDEALGAGAPALVRELVPEGRTWLLVPGEDDRLRMALLAPDAVSTSALVGEDALRGGEILAASAGKRCGSANCALFLLARSRSRAVELSVAECRP